MQHRGPESAPIPPGFLLGIFLVAGIVGAVIAYLGFTGALGAPIP